jgi:chromate transporter
VRAFLDGAGPAAIAGAAIPLALALTETWQFAVLAAAALALFVLRHGIVPTLIAAGITGALASALGAPLPT